MLRWSKTIEKYTDVDPKMRGKTVSTGSSAKIFDATNALGL